MWLTIYTESVMGRAGQHFQRAYSPNHMNAPKSGIQTYSQCWCARGRKVIFVVVWQVVSCRGRVQVVWDDLRWLAARAGQDETADAAAGRLRLGPQWAARAGVGGKEGEREHRVWRGPR